MSGWVQPQSLYNHTLMSVMAEHQLPCTLGPLAWLPLMGIIGASYVRLVVALTKLLKVCSFLHRLSCSRTGQVEACLSRFMQHLQACRKATHS